MTFTDVQTTGAPRFVVLGRDVEQHLAKTAFGYLLRLLILEHAWLYLASSLIRLPDILACVHPPLLREGAVDVHRLWYPEGQNQFMEG